MRKPFHYHQREKCLQTASSITNSLKYSSLFFGVLITYPILAEELATEATSQEPLHKPSAEPLTQPLTDSTFQSWVDDTQLSISDSIQEYGTSFDHFVGKKKKMKPP